MRTFYPKIILFLVLVVSPAMSAINDPNNVLSKLDTFIKTCDFEGSFPGIAQARNYPVLQSSILDVEECYGEECYPYQTSIQALPDMYYSLDQVEMTSPFFYPTYNFMLQKQFHDSIHGNYLRAFLQQSPYTNGADVDVWKYNDITVTLNGRSIPAMEVIFSYQSGPYFVDGRIVVGQGLIPAAQLLKVWLTVGGVQTMDFKLKKVTTPFGDSPFCN